MVRTVFVAILMCQITVGIAAAQIISEGRIALAVVLCYGFGLYVGLIYAKLRPETTRSVVGRNWHESRVAFLIKWLIIVPLAGALFSSIEIPRALKAHAK